MSSLHTGEIIATGQELLHGWSVGGIRNNTASPTPNLGALAKGGLVLSRHYTYMYCSPTRRSFLSGRFPVHISEGQADACSNYLPLNFTLLSAKLQGAGFVSHFVGKGHLGYQTTDHLPIHRGFATHVGYLAAWESYEFGNNMGCGRNSQNNTCLQKDFWHDHQPGQDVVDEINYSTNYYTNRAVALIHNSSSSSPLWVHLAYQAVHGPYTNPPAWNLTDSSAFCGGICQGCHPGNGGCVPKGPKCDASACHVFGDMLTVVDSGVGNVTQSLHDSGRYDDALILVSSDNGGVGPGNNFPLRGHKMQPWEGGTRTAAFLTGGFLPAHLRGTDCESFIHIAVRSLSTFHSPRSPLPGYVAPGLSSDLPACWVCDSYRTGTQPCRCWWALIRRTPLASSMTSTASTRGP